MGHISGVADHFDRCADLNASKEFRREVVRHPHTTVRCRVARQKSPMHPQKWPELHVIRHWSRHIVTSRRHTRTRSRIRVNDSAVTIDHKTKIGRYVIQVLACYMVSSNRRTSTLFARSNWRNKSDSPVLKQIGSLLSQVKNHGSAFRSRFWSCRKND